MAGPAAVVAGVVVTRDEERDGPLTALLLDRGVSVHHWPVVRTAPPSDPAPLRSALDQLDAFDWVVFTSPRAVAAVVDQVAAPLAARPRCAAVGEATARALEEAGWPVELVPETQTGQALVHALLRAGLGSGSRVLFPASQIARDAVPDGLGEAGVVVAQVEAYRTEAAAPDRDACRAALDRGAVALVTFTSPSTVVNLERGLGRELFERVRTQLAAVAIGPTTGEAAERAGFEVFVAEPHSLEGLADRVAEVASTTRRGKHR